MAEIDATRFTAELRIPAVSQVSTAPLGGSGNTQARQAVLPGITIEGHAVAADGGGIDPGQGILHGEVIDQVPGFEVVGAVEN